MNAAKRIILALDGLSLEQALSLTRKVGNRVHAIKIHDLSDRHGPNAVGLLRDVGAQRVWVDAKLHDIPATVGNRAKAIAASGADMLTVHASGGRAMMEAARTSFPGEVYGITVLTSLSEEDGVVIYGWPIPTKVVEFALMAKNAGLHGVVCSPQEVALLSNAPELKGLKLVIPGTRSAGKATGGQARVDTPANAISAGATYLVIGRQVTQAADPVAALDELEAEIQAAHDETVSAVTGEVAQ